MEVDPRGPRGETQGWMGTCSYTSCTGVHYLHIAVQLNTGVN